MPAAQMDNALPPQVSAQIHFVGVAPVSWFSHGRMVQWHADFIPVFLWVRFEFISKCPVLRPFMNAAIRYRVFSERSDFIPILVRFRVIPDRIFLPFQKRDRRALLRINTQIGLVLDSVLNGT